MRSQVAAPEDGKAVRQIAVDVGVMMVMVVIVVVIVVMDVDVVVIVVVIVVMDVVVIVVVVVSMVMECIVGVGVSGGVGVVLQMDVEVAGIDAALGGAGNVEMPAVQMEALEGFPELFLVCAQIQKGSGGHISADAGGAFKVKSFHFSFSCFWSGWISRLICAAE